MFDAADRKRLGEHAVYPGTFDPVTPGHIDIIDRARLLFPRVTVLVAINGDKQPASTQSERAVQLRQQLPANWDNVSVSAWAGLTVTFCQQHRAGVTIGRLTGYDKGGGHLEFGGWIWRYDLAPLGPSETKVTLTYEPFGPEHLINSLHHLAGLTAPTSPAWTPGG
jgi:cytidyltransferase-like protein